MMDYIFKDINETLQMVEGSYKKLKSYFYFDKTHLFAKKRVSEFENNRNKFSEDLMTISKNLSCKNMDYFKRLIDQINFRILPKKFVSADCKTDCIYSSVDHEQKISKINFFIDMPIELYIIDFLWTLLIGKISNEEKALFRYAAATRFKKSLFNNNVELKTGIDFNSNRSFEPYFELYSTWRNNAFNAIEMQHEKSNTILLCLDMKNFYYSVEFDFSQIGDFLKHDERLESFDFLTSVINEIYFTYTQMIKKYKKGIRVKDKFCVFPIGITSAIILRELYLYQLDVRISKKLSPLYYNRYVDDMLIVLEGDDAISFNKENIIKKFLIDTSIAQVFNKDELKFTGYNIKIQKEKINSFTFLKNQRAVLLDIYEQYINMNSSEANLLPDINVLNSSFTQNAYNIQNLEISNKIRDLGFLKNNNYNATRFINGLQRTIKNTRIKQSIMDNHFDDILEFYSGSQSVEFSNNWRAIFELFVLANDKVRARSVFNTIKKEIDYLDFACLNDDEVYEKKKKQILQRLKGDLKKKLYIAAALATALNDAFGIRKEVRLLAQSFRASNMLNHTMVSYPLINYSKLDSFPMIGVAISVLLTKEKNAFELDEFKLKWTPRYINAIEFFMANFLYGFCNKNHLTINPNVIFSRFIKHNNLGAYLENPFDFSKPSNSQNISHTTANYLFYINDDAENNPKVALVNTKIEEKDALSTLDDPTGLLTIENKIRLFKILNTAKEEKVNILVFPEFYFPVEWLMDISIFAVKNGISIVTGMQYLTFNGQAYNNVCTVIPIITGRSFSTGFLQFREKNFYAPQEKIELSKYGFSCKDNDIPIYYIVDNGKYRFSTILCYEFTDITSRESMKAQIEILFVPQLNKDTNYFSAIVEATTRDLHCFVVQANTSSYGDSRVTAPYKTEKKNILQVKGGDNDVVLISKLDIFNLKKAQNAYNGELKKLISQCRRCKKIHHKSLSYEEKADLCKKCENAYKENDIKGIPPKFDND